MVVGKWHFEEAKGLAVSSVSIGHFWSLSEMM